VKTPVVCLVVTRMSLAMGKLCCESGNSIDSFVTVLSFPSPEPEGVEWQKGKETALAPKAVDVSDDEEGKETTLAPKAVDVSDDEAAGAHEDDEIDADLLAVTHPRWQDKVLRKYNFYENLPDIPCVLTFIIVCLV
jgi:hypothetical protein